MARKTVKTRIGMLALMLPLFAWAAPGNDITRKPVSIDYTMSDSESRVEAKQNARQALAVEAADSARQYVQGTETYQQGQLSEEVEIISAAIVETEDVSFEFSIDPSGHQIITASGEAVIDESQADERIRRIQQDQAIREKVRELSERNHQLRDELHRISSEGIDEVNHQMRTRVYEQYEQLSGSVRQVVEGASILEMVQSRNMGLERAKTDIRENVFQKLTNTPLEAEIVDAYEAGLTTRDAYRVKVDLNYQPDMEAIGETLGQYFQYKLHRGDSALNVKASDNVGKEDYPEPFTPDLWDWIKDKKVTAEVRVGSETFDFVLAYGIHRSARDRRSLGGFSCRVASGSARTGSTSNFCIQTIEQGENDSFQRVGGSGYKDTSFREGELPREILLEESEVMGSVNIETSVTLRDRESF